MKTNFFSRLTLPTPQFWVRVQLVCLGLLVIIGKLAMLQLFPVSLYLTLFGALSGIAVIAQLAVKDQSIIAEACKDPSSLLQHIPEILDQVTQIKTAFNAQAQPVPVVFDDAINAAQKIKLPVISVGGYQPLTDTVSAPPGQTVAPGQPTMTAIVGNLASTDPETKTDVTAALNLILGDKAQTPPAVN